MFADLCSWNMDVGSNLTAFAITSESNRWRDAALHLTHSYLVPTDFWGYAQRTKKHNTNLLTRIQNRIVDVFFDDSQYIQMLMRTGHLMSSENVGKTTTWYAVTWIDFAVWVVFLQLESVDWICYTISDTIQPYIPYCQVNDANNILAVIHIQHYDNASVSTSGWLHFWSVWLGFIGFE